MKYGWGPIFGGVASLDRQLPDESGEESQLLWLPDKSRAPVLSRITGSGVTQQMRSGVNSSGRLAALLLLLIRDNFSANKLRSSKSKTAFGSQLLPILLVRSGADALSDGIIGVEQVGWRLSSSSQFDGEMAESVGATLTDVLRRFLGVGSFLFDWRRIVMSTRLARFFDLVPAGLMMAAAVSSWSAGWMRNHNRNGSLYTLLVLNNRSKWIEMNGRTSFQEKM